MLLNCSLRPSVGGLAHARSAACSHCCESLSTRRRGGTARRSPHRHKPAICAVAS